MNDGSGFNLVANCLADGDICNILGGFGLKVEVIKVEGLKGGELYELPAMSTAAASSSTRLLMLSSGRGRVGDNGSFGSSRLVVARYWGYFCGN